MHNVGLCLINPVPLIGIIIGMQISRPLKGGGSLIIGILISRPLKGGGSLIRGLHQPLNHKACIVVSMFFPLSLYNPYDTGVYPKPLTRNPRSALCFVFKDVQGSEFRKVPISSVSLGFWAARLAGTGQTVLKGLVSSGALHNPEPSASNQQCIQEETFMSHTKASSS